MGGGVGFKNPTTHHSPHIITAQLAGLFRTLMDSVKTEDRKWNATFSFYSLLLAGGNSGGGRVTFSARHIVDLVSVVDYGPARCNRNRGRPIQSPLPFHHSRLNK